MVRRWLVIAIGIFMAQSALACPCIIPSGRDLIGGARLVAIVTYTGENELRIQAVLHGIRTGDVLRSKISTCILGGIGDTFLAAEQCIHGDCYVAMTPIDGAADDLAFLHGRRFVSRAEVLDELRAWQSGQTPTRRFRDWVSMADTEEVDRYPSLTVPLLNALQRIARVADKADRNAPAAVTALLRGPIASLIDRLTLLPAEETEEDYEPVCRNDPEAIPWDVHMDVLDDAVERVFESSEHDAVISAIIER